MSTLRTALVTLTAALALAACGEPASSPTVTQPTGGDAAPSAPAAASDAALNDADVAFLQGMIPHHAQAVEMAELVPDRTDRAELAGLAEEIIATQEAEIETMTALLAAGGEEPAEDMGMDHGGGMAGMMSSEDMEALAGLSDEDFDLRFLAMMTEHHQGAIEQAQTVLDGGASPEVATLADDIIAAQEAEIAQMQQWQEEWAA